MNRVGRITTCITGVLFLLAAASAVVLAAKPTPPPPPPPAPPAIIFDLHLLGINQQPLDVNDAGDMILGLDSVLFAGNTAATPVADLPHEEQWALNHVYAINGNCPQCF